jgi:hypothetical protein
MATVAELETRLNELTKKLEPSRQTTWSNFLEKVIIGAATAVVLGALGLLYNWASHGGIVRALGGVVVTDAQSQSLMTFLDRLKLSPSAFCVDNPGTNYRLCFEADGNLVIYDTSKPAAGTSNGTSVWASGRPR